MPPHQIGPDSRRRSRRRTAVVGAAGLVLLLILVAVVVAVLRSDPEDGAVGRPEADGDDGADAQEADDETGTVDLDDAAFGDLVAVGGESHGEPIEDMAVAALSGGEPVVVTGADDGARVWDLRTGDLTGAYEEDYGGAGVELDVIDVDGRAMVYSRDWSNWTQGLWSVDDPSEVIDAEDAHHDEDVRWVGSWDGGVPVYITEYGAVTNLLTGENLEYVDRPYFNFWTVMEIGGERRAVGIPETDGVYVTEHRIVVRELEEDGEIVGGTFDPITPEIADHIAGFTTGRIGDLALAATAVTTPESATLQAWNLETAERYGTTVQEPDLGEILGLELTSIDGRAMVLVWTSEGLSLFDMESGERVGETFARPGAGELTTAAVAEVDGHPVAVTGTTEGDVAVWSIDH